MKRKQGKRRGDRALGKPNDAETAALRRYRTKLVAMLNDVHLSMGQAPAEMNIPREGIQGLLMASFYLLDVNEGLVDMDDTYFIRSAIRELEKALEHLGLGIDYWDNIKAWRARDMKEQGETDFLVVD